MLSRNQIKFIQSLKQKKFRLQHQLFVVEGEKIVNEFLNSDWEIEQIYATKEWKGGKSKKKWETHGKNENPGRLNDLLHIIYKDADTKWGNCKNNLGLILKEGLLKENIDGEALTWANNRLKVRQEKKKILIVISDGAPVDDATLSANSPEILDDHLKEVVLGIEKTTNIKLLAIGIGHDVSKYYKNAFVIEDAKNLGDVIIDNLSLMLGAKKY